MDDSRNGGVRFTRPPRLSESDGGQVEPAGKLRRRKEIRLKSYDYKSDGCYFVTICTHRGRPNMRQYREVVERILLSLPERFSGLKIDWYVLMPTHLHVIFAFDGMKDGLAGVVRTFKALVTRNTGVKFWQRNYYEHVIRNETALFKIREYIENNPLAERIRFDGFYESGSDKSDPYKN